MAVKEIDCDMKVAKSWSEYSKDINRLRAALRYAKKAVNTWGSGSVYENECSIIEIQKEIKRLCKLRDCAKAMEKAKLKNLSGDKKCKKS